MDFNMTDVFGDKVDALEGVNNDRLSEKKIDLLSSKSNFFDKKVCMLKKFNKGDAKMNGFKTMAGVQFGGKSNNTDRKADMLMSNKQNIKQNKDFDFNKKINAYMNNQKKNNMYLNSFSNNRNSSNKVVDHYFNANKRIQQQRGLNMFGDFDRDKVPNILDCDPRNKYKQGFLHDIKSGAQTVGSAIKKTGGAIATGARTVVEASGIPESIERGREQREWESNIKKEAREEALKEVQKIKAKDIYREQVNKILGTRQRVQRTGTYPRTYTRPYNEYSRSGVEMGVRRAASDIHSGIGAASPQHLGVDMSRYMGWGTGYGASAMVGRGSREPFSVKVDDIVGTGKLRQEWQNQQATQPTSQVVVPQAPVSVVQDSYQRDYRQEGDVQQRQGLQYSPYSKRYVRYPRGPYKKRIKYVMPDQQY